MISFLSFLKEFSLLSARVFFVLILLFFCIILKFLNCFCASDTLSTFPCLFSCLHNHCIKQFNCRMDSKLAQLDFLFQLHYQFHLVCCVNKQISISFQLKNSILNNDEQTCSAHRLEHYLLFNFMAIFL